MKPFEDLNSRLDALLEDAQRLTGRLNEMGYTDQQAARVIKYELHPRFAIVSKRDLRTLMESRQNIYMLDLKGGNAQRFASTIVGTFLLKMTMNSDQFALATDPPKEEDIKPE